MLHDLERFRGLTALERGCLIRAFFLLPIVGWGLRMVGFREIQAVLHGFSTAPGYKFTPGEAMENALTTSRMVAIASRHGFYRANCLSTSLALVYLLGKQGVDTKMRVGVCKVAGLFEAHAWVEFQGQPINDDVDVHERFPAFDEPICPLKKKSG